MRVRFTTLLGMPVTDDRLEEDLGAVCGILIRPDEGVVEGFFVGVSGFLSRQELFLPTSAILHVGTRIRVSHGDVLSPPAELIRLSSLLNDPRTILGQKMLTESGRSLGRCMDIQCETTTFRIEWLFPRKWFTWKRPIPITSILEVREDAIVIRDQSLTEKTPEESPVLPTLEPLVTPAASRIRH